MEQENQLEREIKEFDWKEWAPLIGLYYAPRNILMGERSQSIGGNMALVNGAYHCAVSILPIINVISQLMDKYL